MRYNLLSLGAALGLMAVLNGCKKSEPPAPATPPSEPQGQAEKPKPAAPPAPAGPAVEIKVKWPVGNRYVYRMDMDQHSTNHIPMLPKPMQQDTSMSMTYALAVLKEIPDGGREVEMEFIANEMEVKMGEQVVMSFDSKETGKEEAQNPIAGPFRKMIGTKVVMQVKADGKVDKVLGLDEWKKTITGDAAGPMGAMLGQQFKEDYFRQMADFSRGLPDKAVKVGDTWQYQLDVPAGQMGKISLNSNVAFHGWEERDQRKCAALHLTGTFDGSPGPEMGPLGKMTIEEGKANGISWYDPELGCLIESAVDQTMRMKGELPGQPGGKAPGGAGFTIELAQKVSVKLVELGKVVP